MSIRNIRKVRNQPRQQDEAAMPFSVMNRPSMPFDDSNRENYIMRSSRGLPTLFDRAKDVAPIQIFPPNPNPNIIVDYEKGKGGRDLSMLPLAVSPDFAPIEPIIETTPGPVDMMPSPVDPLPADSLQDRLRDLLDMDPTDAPQGNVFMAGLLGPGPGLGDMTGEGGIIQKLGEMLGLIDPIDPENDGLPMDEFQPYDPNNPNMFMLPEGMDLDDMDVEDIINQMREPKIEASADTYTLPNLLQMLQDARDAGNEDEIELLTNDLEMLFPGSTMTI